MISKKVESVKKDLYNINMPYFEFPAVYEKLNLDVGYLTEDQGFEAKKFFNIMFWDFRGENDSLITFPVFHDRKYIPFFYSTGFYNFFKHYDCKIAHYFNTIRNKFREPLGFPKQEQNLVNIIETVDEINISNLYNFVDDIVWHDYAKKILKDVVYRRNMVQLPRFRKLCRLRVFNNFITNMCLEMLQLFYWIDFKNNITNTKNINEYIDIVLNITLQLKDMLYVELEKEFPDDIIKKEIDRIRLKP